MLQLEAPQDFVIATEETHSVRKFVEIVAGFHNLTLSWEGEGVEEVGKDQNGVVRVRVNPKFYRPNEVDALCGDITKAKTVLKWEPQTSFEDLVKMMAESDLKCVSANS